MLNKNQQQQAGDHSTNIQGQSVTVVQNGVSYLEVREIALDIFKSNFYKLSEQAALTAQKRAEEVTDNFLQKLRDEKPQALEAMATPDMQFNLFTVQKEYARTGDLELSELLVDILLRRATESHRTLLQIVLNESLSVASKLTLQQIDILSVIFLVRYSKTTNATNLFNLFEYLDNTLLKFANEESLTKEISCYQHLEFTGCASIGLDVVEIEDIYRKEYGGNFSKGFTMETFKEELGGYEIDNIDDILIKCYHDSSLWQISAVDLLVIENIGKKNGLPQEVIEKLKNLFSRYLMQNNELIEYLIKMRPNFEIIFDYWKGSRISDMSLSSVGIAIAIANIKSKAKYDFDMRVWIR